MDFNINLLKLTKAFINKDYDTALSMAVDFQNLKTDDEDVLRHALKDYLGDRNLFADQDIDALVRAFNLKYEDSFIDIINFRRVISNGTTTEEFKNTEAYKKLKQGTLEFFDSTEEEELYRVLAMGAVFTRDAELIDELIGFIE